MAIDPTIKLSPLRPLFFILVKIVVLVALGLHVRRKYLLPQTGPAIIVANHNSHLDTLVLLSLMPLSLLKKTRPVAAEDYFMRNKWFAWFSLRIIGIIPLKRLNNAEDRLKLLDPCRHALERGEILILFPEGTRGVAEKMVQFKKGIAHLVKEYPAVGVTPVFMHGLGKALPKGEWVFVPFFCDIFVGEKIYFAEKVEQFMALLEMRFDRLVQERSFAFWE